VQNLTKWQATICLTKHSKIDKKLVFIKLNIMKVQLKRKKSINLKKLQYHGLIQIVPGYQEL